MSSVPNDANTGNPNDTNQPESSQPESTKAKLSNKASQLLDSLSNKAKANANELKDSEVSEMAKRVAKDAAAEIGKEVAKQVGKEVGDKIDAKRHEAKERAQQLGGKMRSSFGERLRGLKMDLRQKADEHLEQLMEDKPLSDEARKLLEERRNVRLEESRSHRAKKQLLAAATTSPETAVMRQVVAATPWAGGEIQILRYTQLLDNLSDGSPASEMAIHRAIWSLAERGVLSVAAHGAVTACVLAVLPTESEATE